MCLSKKRPEALAGVELHGTRGPKADRAHQLQPPSMVASSMNQTYYGSDSEVGAIVFHDSLGAKLALKGVARSLGQRYFFERRKGCFFH